MLQKLQNYPYHQCFFKTKLPKKCIFPIQVKTLKNYLRNGRKSQIQLGSVFRPITSLPAPSAVEATLILFFLEYFFAEKLSERFQQPDLYCVYSADRSSVTVVLDKL